MNTDIYRNVALEDDDRVGSRTLEEIAAAEKIKVFKEENGLMDIWKEREKIKGENYVHRLWDL